MTPRSERIDALEERLAVLEARMITLEALTGPSTDRLGSTYQPLSPGSYETLFYADGPKVV